jgi:hypothetical protein
MVPIVQGDMRSDDPLDDLLGAPLGPPGGCGEHGRWRNPDRGRPTEAPGRFTQEPSLFLTGIRAMLSLEDGLG